MSAPSTVEAHQYYRGLDTTPQEQTVLELQNAQTIEDPVCLDQPYEMEGCKLLLERLGEGEVCNEGGRATPAINGSEPLDLQDLTPNPAAEPRTPQQSREPRGRGLRTPAKLAPNPSKNGSIAIFNIKKPFFCQNSFVMFKIYINTSTK